MYVWCNIKRFNVEFFFLLNNCPFVMVANESLHPSQYQLGNRWVPSMMILGTPNVWSFSSRSLNTATVLLLGAGFIAVCFHFNYLIQLEKGPVEAFLIIKEGNGIARTPVVNSVNEGSCRQNKEISRLGRNIHREQNYNHMTLL